MNRQQPEFKPRKSEKTGGERPKTSRHSRVFLSCIGALLFGFSFCLVGGCEPSSDLEYCRPSVAPEKLRDIQTLQLKKAKDQKRGSVDVNEVNQPPPKEMKLTLEQCRALVLENDLDLKVQLINPTVAAEKVTEQEAQFESAFFSNVRYGKTDTPVASFIDIAGSKLDYSSTDLGVRVPLRSGGTVTFDLADNRTKTDSIYSIFNPSYGSNASVSISQPLLRNAGKRANTYAICIAEYERQITDARTKLEVIRAIAAVDRVYWRLYAARRELEVRQQQYELAQALFEQAKRFVAAGERSQVEVIRTEAGVADRLEAIIVAQNTVHDRERDLKRTINKAGLGMQTPTMIVPTTEPDPVRYDLKKDRLVAIAIKNRMEMLELELQIDEDIATTDYMKNQALPLVTMDYTYNVNGLGPTRGDSYDLLLDKRFEDHRLGLQLLVPLGNAAAKSRLRQAFYQRRLRLASRDSRKAAVTLDVLNAIDQVDANWQRILASRQSSILDGRLFEAEKRQFELGLGTSTEVLEAQTDFANAQSAEIQALTEYQISLVDLAYATGTLLGAAKIRWEPVVPTAGMP
jgi:outer membrane protein